jgi:hypothetical protein
MNSYYRSKAIGNTANSIQNSGCFENYGAYIGLFLSAVWIIGSIYFLNDLIFFIKMFQKKTIFCQYYSYY